MRILDLDLDTFIYPVLHDRQAGTRPTNEEVTAWTSGEVRTFLEDRCGISTQNPIQGKLFQSHDEVLGAWRKDKLAGILSEKFEVVHIDAHPDLGLPDRDDPIRNWIAEKYQAGHLPTYESLQLEDPGLNLGNYLLCALAFNWISELTLVYPPAIDFCTFGIPLQFIFGVDGSGISNNIHLPGRPFETKVKIPYFADRTDFFNNEGRFDLAYVSLSPEYVSKEAEKKLLPVIREYISSI